MKPAFAFLFISTFSVLLSAMVAERVMANHPGFPLLTPLAPDGRVTVIPSPIPLNQEQTHLDSSFAEPTIRGQETIRGQSTTRGQSSMFGELGEILSNPIPIARGPIDEGVIDPKLLSDAGMENPNVHEAELSQTGNSQTGNNGVSRVISNRNEQQPPRTASGTHSTNRLPVDITGSATAIEIDPIGYSLLLVATVITTIGLVWMVFVAYDYRQRWMQSLTIQNERYLSSGVLDLDLEELYSMPELKS